MTTWASVTTKVDGALEVEQPGGTVSSHADEPAPLAPLKVVVAVSHRRVRHTDIGLADNEFGCRQSNAGFPCCAPLVH
jgi:hypothetical protein